MKYAIILHNTKTGDKYLTGFTNKVISKQSGDTIKYTIELTELSHLFVKLTGDAAVYL
jgi:hypothetical protein